MKHLLIAMMILSLFGFVVGCNKLCDKEVTDGDATEECGRDKHDCETKDEACKDCDKSEECECPAEEEVVEETVEEEVPVEEGGE